MGLNNNTITMNEKDLQILSHLIKESVTNGLCVEVTLDSGNKVAVYKPCHNVLPKPTPIIDQPNEDSKCENRELIQWIKSNTYKAETQQRVYKLYIAYIIQSSPTNDVDITEFRETLSKVHDIWKTKHRNWFTYAKLSNALTTKVNNIENVMDEDTKANLMLKFDETKDDDTDG